MSILIKGMEMPKGRPVCIVIDAAGQARRYDLNNDRYADDKLFEAVPIPTHGRLIDADALMEYIKNALDCYGNETQIKTTFGTILDYIKARINDATTIIPASEEGE